MSIAKVTTLQARTARAAKQAALALCLISAAALYWSGSLEAAAPAGASIGNQASATYSDASAVTRTVTSNAVITIMQQVASVDLTNDGAKYAAVGGQVVYPHTIINNGNGTDRFTLAASNASGTTNLSNITIYADANGDGVPDSTTGITNSGDVAAGGTFKFVVVGNVSGAAVAGNTNTMSVVATSVFNNTQSDTNSDVTTVSTQGVVQVTQALDVTSGPSPNTGRTITITYTNVGNTTATNLTLAELLPSGMTYVTTSGRWSVTGSTTLTDASAADNQSGIIYDYGITNATTVTAVIASVAPGASGTLTFRVDIASNLPPGANPATAATATYLYNDGSGNTTARNTNTVQYTVAQTASVTVSDSTVASITQGGTVTFTNIVTNTGSGTDTFNMTTGGTATFPVGTAFQFYRADGVTPLLDTNNDGIPDTGPIARTGTYNVIVKAILPSGSTGGPYVQQIVATSKTDPTKTGTGTDTLTVITTSLVDVTNNAAGLGNPGYGAGPEGAAVVTNTVNPGATTTFTLVIANTSGVSDSYNLAVSSDGFSTLGLPAGWTVVFKDANGTVVTNSGVINAGQTKPITAEVTPPATAIAGTTQVYFRVQSPTSGSTDILRDAVTVNTTRSLSLAPNQTGQVTTGGVHVFTHTIINTGNVVEGTGVASSVALSLTQSNSAFTSVVYWDINNDGVLDAADPVVTNLSELVGGTGGASTGAGLDVGERATLFVKVTAPAGASIGATNTTTLTATTTGVINTVAAPAVATVTDNLTVIASQVTLVKTQALDANCDGTADTAFSSSIITTGAVPNACVRYQIVAMNAGGTTITGLVVNDATPFGTTYHGTVAGTTSVGTISLPTAGAAGLVQATIGTLTSGQSATVNFGVLIAP